MTSKHEHSPKTASSVAPTTLNLQTRPFAPIEAGSTESPSAEKTEKSEYQQKHSPNILEKLINSSPPELASSVQRKPENRLKAIARNRSIQAKLAIGEPNDKYEKEADDTASKVVQQINTPIQNQSIQRDALPQVNKLRKKPLQRRENVGGGDASTELESSIQRARGSGQSLDANLQQSMGQAMGADFSGVKVHTDSQSDQLNQSIQAKAFTTGQDVFFRQGAYEPSSRGGQELIAHELTHVVQQNGGLQRSPQTSTSINNASSLAQPIQRKLDDRATSWEDIDKQATMKRLAVASEEYKASGGAGGTGGAFDKSLVASNEEVEEIDQRIAEQKQIVETENDIDRLPKVFWTVYKKNPDLAVKQFSLSTKQQATLKARDAGKVGGISNFDAFIKDKGDAAKEARYAAKEQIATPEDLFSPAEIAAHLGKFKNGAHAFIDIGSSSKIMGWMPGFHGWGAIKKNNVGGIADRASNFVAPLDEANAANAKAHQADGIETLENDLGIPSKNWSNSKGNPGKKLMRWVIPQPKLTLDEETTGVLLKMATGREVGADPDFWVAGGFTKGGAHEATLDAIPREDLITLLSDGEIKQKIEHYPETGDEIPWGPNQPSIVGKKP
jgi:hypothetical protein